MSSAHARPEQITAEQVHRWLKSMASRHAAQVHELHGDEFRPVKDWLVAMEGELNDLAERVIPKVEPAGPREPGLDTQAWLANGQPMRRNGGQWSPR